MTEIQITGLTAGLAGLLIGAMVAWLVTRALYRGRERAAGQLARAEKTNLETRCAEVGR